ncbi:MAG: hypothetical protein H6737_02095 [Alphaproteobacteria bacterium]|nr:hypothetical protein [Alphaproteobacteria bacterium]
MNRALTAALLVVGLTQTASAADVYMWGVGPRIGTNFLPGAYPSAFPRMVADDIVDGTDADPIPVIDKVRGDVSFGFEAQYYVNGGSRIGMIGGFDVGKRFFDANVLLKYNIVLQSASVDFLFGGGAGFGTQAWRGGPDAELARLRVPYFPLRVEAAGMIRAGWMAFQLTPYFQYNLQSNVFYTSDDGNELDVRGGVYPTMGIELSALFGDYEPPQPRKRK